MSKSSVTGRNASDESPVELWEDLSSELWQVKDVMGPKTVTLDELDDAFKRDEITTHSLVRRVGALKWQTLAEVAGIEPSSPMLESESLMPVTSEIDVTAPKIPRPPAVPRISPAGFAPRRPDDSYEALQSADLLPDVNDTLKVTRFAGVGATFDDDDVTTRYRQGAPTAAPQSSTARKAFAVAAVAVIGLGVFGGTRIWLSREFGRANLSAAAAMVAPPPVAAPPPAAEPARGSPDIAAIEGSILVLAPMTVEGEVPSAVSAPSASAVTVAKRPPVTRVVPRKPATGWRSHFSVKAEPKKGSFASKGSASHSFKAKMR